MKGFVSLLFLLALATLLTTTLTLHPPTIQHPPELDILFLRRTEMENGIDSIIHDEMNRGLILNLPAEEIKTLVNGKILQYVNQFPNEHDEPLTYSNGMGILPFTSYSNLLTTPLTPLSLEILNSHSHVIVLPLSETLRYGEYSYTGGPAATGIVVTMIHSDSYQTLFAIPSGYHACGTNLIPTIDCTKGN